MALEIERKFLVLNADFITHSSTHYQIIQGYLSVDKQRTVRIRVFGDKAFITIKGENDKAGLMRFEWEKEIPVAECQELLKLALPGLISKTRYIYHFDDHVWEIDCFHGDNEGLILAEIELNDPSDSFDIPPFIGAEVTGDKRYYNSYLINNPYSTWR